MTSRLIVDNVTKSFGGIHALKGVSLEAEQGSILAIIGPNGSGKTTLLNIVTGIYVPDSGKITLGGRELKYDKPHHTCASGIARTFQNIRLFKGMPVLDNVMAGQTHQRKLGLLHILGNSERGRAEEDACESKARELIGFVGLAGKEKARASDLTYAQQRLLEIARALATSPKIVLLDEPAAGMNQLEINHLEKLILSIQKKGITVILIEHVMGLVREVADNIIVLSEGVKIASGSFEEIQCNQAVIDAYLGKGKVAAC